MLDTSQIEQLERKMREEHQKDLDALTRLKRYMPTPAEQVSAAKPKEQGVDPAPRLADSHTTEVVKSLRAHVAEIMAADPTIMWDAPKMVATLQARGVALQAKTPTPGIQLIMARWLDLGKALLVRKGSGRTPNIYQWKAGATIDGTPEANM
jgi:hypothetical protein